MTDLVSNSRIPGATSKAIKSTALDLFATIGYEAASMRQIAAAVGIQPASLYNHYSSKEQLLWGICRDAMASLIESGRGALDEGGNDDPAEQLRLFMRQHVQFHLERRDDALVINRQLMSLDDLHYTEITEMRDEYEKQLRTVLARGLKREIFCVPNTRLASYALLAIGLHISAWYREDGPMQREDIVDTHEQMALQLVGVR